MLHRVNVFKKLLLPSVRARVHLILVKLVDARKCGAVVLYNFRDISDERMQAASMMWLPFR